MLFFFSRCWCDKSPGQAVPSEYCDLDCHEEEEGGGSCGGQLVGFGWRDGRGGVRGGRGAVVVSCGLPCVAVSVVCSVEYSSVLL